MIQTPLGHGTVNTAAFITTPPLLQLLIRIQHQQLSSGMEAARYKITTDGSNFVGTDRTTQRLGQLEKLTRTLLPVLGNSGLVTHSGCQLANQHAHCQHHGKRDQILHIADGKGEVGIHEEKIENADIEYGRQGGRASTKTQGDEHHPQQKDHDNVGGIEERHHQPRHAS